jgi:3-oxo-5-alpha-steroid 4-dehydrogenase 1
MRPGSVFGLTTLGLVSRTSMDDRLGDGPPLWEGEQQFHAFLGYALFTSMAAACAALSLGAVAPYGRYSNEKALGISDWGPKVPAQLAWCLQELPSLVVPLVCLVRRGWGPTKATNGVLLLGFLAHYAHRALVYPLRIRGGAPTPAYVMASATLFTLTNGYLQAGALGGPWASAVPGDAAFGGGVLLFLAGALGNAYHDALLRALREPGETGYKVPTGGLFDYVSGANYLCEMVEWAGFALACRTPAAQIFAACVIFNLAPRAVSHHAWYRAKFGDAYPAQRRALVPFLF